MKVQNISSDFQSSSQRTTEPGGDQPSGRGSRKNLRRALIEWLVGHPSASPRRGRLLLEPLESRQLLAGDVEWFSTTSAESHGLVTQEPAIVSVGVGAEGEGSTTAPEGESAPDLVAFAKALAAAEVVYYGAAWCPFCTVQKELFADGGQFLPFVEVSNADRSLNDIGIEKGIETFPTWDFPDGSRATGVLSLQELSQRSGVAIPQSSSPSFVQVGNQSVGIGSPLHVPVDAYNPAGGPIQITVEVDDPELLEAVVLTGNRSVRISVAGYGDMVFELFEDRAPRPALRVIELAETGFYDDTIFHRIIDGFVIQGGDPTGTGTGGSPLGNFDDQYHPELQHNRAGVLSFAKSTDDTNNSQFFITAGPTRTLDFNHSIFGQLVEGERVRAAINNIANPADRGTNAADRPLIDIRIDSMTVFEDDQNAVIMLKPKGNQAGTTTVRIIATNAEGESYTEEITVNVVPDSGVGSNSAPFLADIPALPNFPNDQPATLQLSSFDVEGDPVEYFVSTNSTDVAATVNPTTGLVTVTPNNNFVGNAVVTVGVRPAPGVAGALAGQSDTQRLTFTFVANAVPAAPSSLTLAASSDTGSSDSDRITRAGSLTFNIGGVQAGAEVVLFAGSVEIGRGVASGTTTSITTNNVAALGDGTYVITARQIQGGEVSPSSQPLTITYDATPPIRMQNFPTAGNVGLAIDVDLNHPEEGEGLIYGLGAAPQGAAINPQTGRFTWTPTTSQLGPQNVTLLLTDLAGNVREEVFTINVADVALAGARLEVTDLEGNVIDRVQPGDEFLIRFFASDQRDEFDRAGVFSAFIDLRFDNDLIRPVATSPIQFGPNFGSVISSGSVATGLIDELGAVSNSLAPTNRAEDLIATVRMTAVAAGTATILSEASDVSGNDFLLFLEDAAVPPARVSYGRLNLEIADRFVANDDTFQVAQGSTPTLLDVLANDEFAAGETGTLAITAVGTPSAGGTVTIEGDRIRYQPTATFVGTETFTYQVTDNTGITKTANVAVTVTGEAADNPTAVNDAFTVVEDAPFAEFDVLANDLPAVAGSTISVTAVGTPNQGGVAEIVAQGQSIRYRPAANFFGTETLTYTITDTTGGTATATVTFTVTAVNDPPPADDISRDLFLGDTNVVVATLADYGVNVDGDETLTVAIVGQSSAGGSFVVDGTSIRYTPPSAAFVGTDVVTYSTTDPGGLTSTGTLTVRMLDSLPTTYRLKLEAVGRPVLFNGTVVATLTGTTKGGQSI
ncbi:MAG: tandem-95 repeat protein, partial [Planctomycetaceae bacterium]